MIEASHVPGAGYTLGQPPLKGERTLTKREHRAHERAGRGTNPAHRKLKPVRKRRASR